MSTHKNSNNQNLLAIKDITQEKFDKKIEFKPIIEKFVANFSLIHVDGTKIYMRTTYKAPKGKVMMVDLSKMDDKNPMWSFETVLPERKDVLDSCRTADFKLICTYMVDASDRLKVFEYGVPAKELTEIKLPDMGSVKGLTGKYNEKDLFFTFTSFSDPGSTYHVDMDMPW